MDKIEWDAMQGYLINNKMTLKVGFAMITGGGKCVLRSMAAWWVCGEDDGDACR
jgi:hypothetical protein